MNKIVIVMVTLAVLSVGGWYGFQQVRVIQAKRAEKARVAAVRRANGGGRSKTACPANR